MLDSSLIAMDVNCADKYPVYYKSHFWRVELKMKAAINLMSREGGVSSPAAATRH